MLRRLIAPHFNYNSSRVYLEEFLAAAAATVKPHEKVLDAGAGDCKYKALFAGKDYTATDFLRVDKPYDVAALDIVCDLHDLAVSDATYDVVICSQVLEHLPDPEHVLRELHRVLKPNGRLWLSTPLFFEEHEVPHDYYRYTRYGLRYLLEKSGFQIQQMAWLEGYYGTIAYQLKTMALALPRTPQDYGGDSISYLLLPFMVLLKVIFGGLTVFFTRLDLRYKYTERGHCKNYAAVAVKLPSTLNQW
ncbi:MAG TPA: class I SAM-dependent methyltransferase [Caldilineaceae bacterium]|nr:class I SAM-dependent methyltransferase [Caldilineaceae bacterium]